MKVIMLLWLKMVFFPMSLFFLSPDPVFSKIWPVQENLSCCKDSYFVSDRLEQVPWFFKKNLWAHWLSSASPIFRIQTEEEHVCIYIYVYIYIFVYIYIYIYVYTNKKKESYVYVSKYKFENQGGPVQQSWVTNLLTELSFLPRIFLATRHDLFCPVDIHIELKLMQNLGIHSVH